MLGTDWSKLNAMDLSDIVENIKQGREAALLGNYDSATVYYQSVITQMSKHLRTYDNDPSLRVGWQKVSAVVWSVF